MKPEIRNLKAELLLSAGVCSLAWQGDFGKGVSTGSGVWSDPGANPCLLYGPVPTSGVSGNGSVTPQWKLGMVLYGDSAAEFVFCKLALGSTTDLLPGQAYQWDENFNLTLLTTSASVLNAEIGVLNVWSPQTAAGTYYAWVQRAGHAAVQAAASSIATGQAETTATAGQVKFLAAASHTAGTKSTGDVAAFGASSSITFTGTTTSGSPYVTNVVSGNANGGVADLTVGMAFTMTGFTNAIIAGIDKQGGQWRILVGTNTAGSYATNQNATASGSVTGTVTSHVVANLKRPTLSAQN
jgi:hypothetical protein